MTGAYADAMAAKLTDMYAGFLETYYGVEFEKPRVGGQYCVWPRGRITVVADPNVRSGERFLLDTSFGGP